MDPEMRRVEFYQLAADGQYRLVSPDDQGVYRSAAPPGFWLRANWLWQQPLPRVLAVLAELKVL